MFLPRGRRRGPGRLQQSARRICSIGRVCPVKKPWPDSPWARGDAEPVHTITAGPGGEWSAFVMFCAFGVLAACAARAPCVPWQARWFAEDGREHRGRGPKPRQRLRNGHGAVRRRHHPGVAMTEGCCAGAGTWHFRCVVFVPPARGHCRGPVALVVRRRPPSRWLGDDGGACGND